MHVRTGLLPGKGDEGFADALPTMGLQQTTGIPPFNGVVGIVLRELGHGSCLACHTRRIARAPFAGYLASLARIVCTIINPPLFYLPFSVS